MMTYFAIAAVVGAGVVTGLLFAFSNFVMQALAKLPNDQGMLAMQQINEKIINPIFVMFFLGTPVLCAIIGINAILALESPGSLSLLIGSVLYLAGPFGITMLFNVPLNNRLAEVAMEDADDNWPDYQIRWQRWNHLRTYVGILSVAMLSAGLISLSF